MYSYYGKGEYLASLLQSSASHDSSKSIELIVYLVLSKHFLLILVLKAVLIVLETLLLLARRTAFM